MHGLSEKVEHGIGETIPRIIARHALTSHVIKFDIKKAEVSEVHVHLSVLSGVYGTRGGTSTTCCTLVSLIVVVVVVAARK